MGEFPAMLGESNREIRGRFRPTSHREGARARWQPNSPMFTQESSRTTSVRLTKHGAATPMNRSGKPNGGRAVLRVLGERGCLLHQRPDAAPQRRHNGGIIGPRRSSSARPPLPAVMFGLPLLLLVSESAHAGNADRSPFRAHRSSPVLATITRLETMQSATGFRFPVAR